MDHTPYTIHGRKRIMHESAFPVSDTTTRRPRTTGKSLFPVSLEGSGALTSTYPSTEKEVSHDWVHDSGEEIVCRIPLVV